MSIFRIFLLRKIFALTDLHNIAGATMYENAAGTTFIAS